MLNQCQDWQCASMQMTINFNSFSDTACPTFKFLYNIAAEYFQNHTFLGRNQYNFDQEKDCCILQGNAVTFLRCSGQMQYH